MENNDATKNNINDDLIISRKMKKKMASSK